MLFDHLVLAYFFGPLCTWITAQFVTEYLNITITITSENFVFAMQTFFTLNLTSNNKWSLWSVL